MKQHIIRKVVDLAKELERAARSIGRHKRAARTLAHYDRPYRLHLGCGRIRLPGWVNVDREGSLETVDLAWDLAYGIPTPNSTCDLIFCEHFLEHLTVEEGSSFLRECQRVLIRGGVLRIAMPSLDVLIERSHNGSWQDQDWLSWPEYQFVKTRAEMLNIAFRWWGHQWLYDREELHRRLKEAGFSEICDVDWGESTTKELRNLESRADSMLICEARK